MKKSKKIDLSIKKEIIRRGTAGKAYYSGGCVYLSNYQYHFVESD